MNEEVKRLIDERSKDWECIYEDLGYDVEYEGSDGTYEGTLNDVDTYIDLEYKDWEEFFKKPIDEITKEEVYSVLDDNMKAGERFDEFNDFICDKYEEEIIDSAIENVNWDDVDNWERKDTSCDPTDDLYDWWKDNQ